jgi:hypothetical protein
VGHSPVTGHVSDDDLERCFLHMVTEKQTLERIREHLQRCHECLDRARAVQGYVKAMKGACAKLRDR